MTSMRSHVFQNLRSVLLNRYADTLYIEPSKSRPSVQQLVGNPVSLSLSLPLSLQIAQFLSI